MNQTNKNVAAEILKKPYARQIVPEQDGSYRGEILEFPGCIALGETQAEAYESLEEIAKSWIEAALDNAQTVPEPIETNGEYSGKLMLRLPKSLHRKATYAAHREGVSLNQFIATAVAANVGEAVPMHYGIRFSAMNTTPDAEMPDAATLEAMARATDGYNSHRTSLLKQALSCEAYRAWLEKEKKDYASALFELYRGVVDRD